MKLYLTSIWLLCACGFVSAMDLLHRDQSPCLPFENCVAAARMIHNSLDLQVLASWFQLKLYPGCCKDAGERFHKSDQWKERSGSVTTVVSILERSMGFEGGQTRCLRIYRQLYGRLQSEYKIIPGYGNDRHVLLDCDRLIARIAKSMTNG